MIQTIVLDLGGVLMNHDIPACVRKFQELLGANFPQLGLASDGEPSDKIHSLLHDYEIGAVTTDEFASALLSLSVEGTTARDILDAWNLMLAGIPTERLEQVLALKKRYPVFLLSNNCDEHWRYCTERFFSSPDEDTEAVLRRYFDEVFLSQEMHLSKPDRRIYEEADRRIAARLGASYDKSHTIFVDDLPANREAAEAFGWQTCSSLEALSVLLYLEEHAIPHTHYSHPEGKTIEEAKRWWHNDGSVHCKNLFFRNHKGNKHYLVCFDCDHDLAIHDLEHRLKASLVAAGQPAPGKLSFASPERMMRYLGLQPGSVSPFGLINDKEHEVILFLDENLRNAPSLSFHPNDCRGTVVIGHDAFEQYLNTVGNEVEYLELY